jgi:activator of 2-hydroxyglutaryl-CoA dehydratase
MVDKLRSLGLCLGASTVSIVQLEQDLIENDHTVELPSAPPRIIAYSLHPHEGDPKRTLLAAFEQLDLDKFDRIAATGRKFRRFVNLTSIAEPEAVEYGYQYIKPADKDCPAVVSAGGETFMVYALDRSGRISNVITGNKCASGTGEFFLQQLRRMNVSLEEAAQWAAVETPHHVSGRCSVFCKSDCTHATNKGTPKSQVTAGLCKMMANKILELLKKIERRNIMITGGTAANRMMIEYLQQEIPGLIVPPEAPYFEALGAALWALEHETAAFPGLSDLFVKEAASFDSLPPLRDFAKDVEFKTIDSGTLQPGDVCILGLDVGSTTTKAGPPCICAPMAIRSAPLENVTVLFWNKCKSRLNHRILLLKDWGFAAPDARSPVCMPLPTVSSTRSLPMQRQPYILIPKSTPYLKLADKMPNTPISPMRYLPIMP